MVKGLPVLDQLFYTTIRLNGLDYENNEITGTAFFFNYRSGVKNHLFLVTNSHTIDEMDKCTLTFHRRKRGKPDFGNPINLKTSNFSETWYHHPKKIDLALMPISPIDQMLVEKNEKIYVQSIEHDLIPSEDEIREEIQPLEDAYFIGYPNGIYDKVNYIPVARKGTVATPLSVDFEGKPWFLFDGAAFPGSSGSPIIMVDQNGYIDRNDVFIPRRRIYFLGILSSCYTFTDRRGRNSRKK